MKAKLQSILKNNKGFTLVELIVVIAIIAVLVAILVPRISGFIGNANESAQLANARNIWNNAVLVQSRIDSGQAKEADFKTEFEALFANDAKVDENFNATGGKVTVNNVDYTVTIAENGDVTVTAAGGISYPIDNTGSDTNTNTQG